MSKAVAWALQSARHGQQGEAVLTILVLPDMGPHPAFANHLMAHTPGQSPPGCQDPEKVCQDAGPHQRRRVALGTRGCPPWYADIRGGKCAGDGHLGRQLGMGKGSGRNRGGCGGIDP